ncbi:MAG: FtsX-like permease family protein [Calditrichaeota bacterium]|nr:FtsX-like permease family protein [Calditrichota bacterium]
MGYELFIAERYLRSKRRTGFISIITYISAAGVMVGVAALVIVLSVANGFEAEVRNRIIGADAHIKLNLFHQMPMSNYVETLQKVSTVKHIVGASPYIEGKGMLRKNKTVEGALLKGIDESTIDQVGDLPNTIVAGKLALRPESINADSSRHHSSGFPDSNQPLNNPGKMSGIVLGAQLSYKLGAFIGDTLIAISPTAMTSFLSAPQVKKFIVTGIFETGIFQYDDTFSYISIESAQDLFMTERAVSGIEIKLENLDQADGVKAELESLLGYPYHARTWYSMHSTLFRWMKMEKWLFTILLSLIILVAAFNIVSSQIMIVLEKRREIGILKAIGASREGIMKIFLYEGMIVGVVGTFLGLIVGYGVCWGQQTFEWLSLPGDVYFLSTLPVQMQILDFIVITIVSLGLAILASVYPARRASALDPVEAIRYE